MTPSGERDTKPKVCQGLVDLYRFWRDYRMLSLVLSTIAFFIAAYFVKRWLDDMGIPKSMTRSIVIFVAAAVVSYAVAFAVDLLMV